MADIEAGHLPDMMESEDYHGDCIYRDIIKQGGDVSKKSKSIYDDKERSFETKIQHRTSTLDKETQLLIKTKKRLTAGIFRIEPEI